jgi:hypothetical protein
MQQEMFEQQWMLNKTLQEKERRSNIISELTDIFFEQKTTHVFSEERLFWLAKWLNITDDIKELPKQVEFLCSVWDTFYFHPFVSPTEAENILSKTGKTKFVLALSSTQPNMIRVSFYAKNTITHRRMNIDLFDMNTFVMEEKIKEIINIANPQTPPALYRPVKYSSREEDIPESISPYDH